MRKLWTTRLRRHQKAQFKYLQLVFNDHFVLALIILAGALLYGYSQLIQQLTPQWWLRPAVAAGLTASLSLGQLAALVEPADATFLLPQTAPFGQFLLRARRYSLLLPGAVLGMAALAVMPLLVVLHIAAWSGTLTLVLALWAFKDADLWLQLLAHYRAFLPRWGRRGLLMGLAFVLLTAGLWWHPAIAMLGAVALNLALRWTVGNHFAPATLDWLGLVAAEDKRMGRLYRFYNLFTDVPGLGGGVRRRKWLDVFLPLVARTPANTWAYLFLRGFLRRTEFLGLTVRLALIGAVVLALVEPVWLVALLALLFVYLVGFQLLPLALAYQEVVFTHLYPLPDAQRTHAFTQLARGVLLLLAGVLALGPLMRGHWLAAGVVLVAGGVAAVGLAQWYFPNRLARPA
ncbi:ABC transporter permease [Lacticaseibacillus daqingensis]|uniref:ABC transporter permease n=1 Tax=Lacticaseibacillus daqingensis TaxID=2486014 RepID=UPI000F782418|nr:ABC transporter permease [Lacticaseibacillus daqingensis]